MALFSLWARHQRAFFHGPFLVPPPVPTSPPPGFPRPHVVDGMDRNPKQGRGVEVVDLHRDGHLPRPHSRQQALTALSGQRPQQSR